MTLFDETVGDMMNESILGRAQERDLIRIEAHQIRAYTLNKQKQVDDYPYGGGHGAVMQADPLYQCWKHITDAYGPGHTIYLSPAGKTFTQCEAKRLLRDYEHLILVCGHYEGIDERFIEACVDEELSIGDFVLTGGELPAMVVADAVARMVPGVLPDPECFEDESHWRSEEHTSELQSPSYLVCRLLLEKNFFNDTATTEIYTLSLHDALPILWWHRPFHGWHWSRRTHRIQRTGFFTDFPYPSENADYGYNHCELPFL